jgi:hypothetical protein
MSKKTKPDLIKEYPEITLTSGEKRKMGILNITKVYMLLNIAYKLLEKGQGDDVAKAFQGSDPMQYLGAILMLGVRHTQVEVTEFLGSFLNMTPQQFEEESIDVTAQLLEGMTRHPDLANFFVTLKKIDGKKMQNLLGTFLTGPSSTSSEKQASATNT